MTSWQTCVAIATSRVWLYQVVSFCIVSRKFQRLSIAQLENNLLL
ncbi:hypothetical protein [aff. Roholtiella sp. LEGE 12411]|nr:hypothetical protein [aff. Roholtiella sp. LEGE 12411]